MATSTSTLIEGFLSWEMATSADGLINSCLLPLVVWLIATSACSLIKGVFCRCDLIDGVFLPVRMIDWWFFDWYALSWEMTTSARFLIGGLYPQEMITSPSTETLYWVVCPSLVWLLDRITIGGLFIGSYPRQWFDYWVDSSFSGWINGCYPFSGLINGLLPLQWYYQWVVTRLVVLINGLLSCKCCA